MSELEPAKGPNMHTLNEMLNANLFYLIRLERDSKPEFIAQGTVPVIREWLKRKLLNAVAPDWSVAIMDRDAWNGKITARISEN